ncbi:1,4-alpha-glucan branching protein [Streptomyces sp. NPDC102278]|uniref:maltokinase N-terminal cap-like domain-containing protein n=1 Tax=Streptomyces sp. NPDC102278 TaxID=3366152 RepID=UPI003810FD2F
MAIIHKTTMSPGKLELLGAWLPDRPWYLPTGAEPDLARAGGFRLDDPAGEVGIEFMVVTDDSGERPTAYHVPLTYRGAPLDGADAALIGTSEHGVLGTRWVYDGAHDPVLVAELLALFQGRAVPQRQSESDTPDPSVTARFDGPGLPALLPAERPEVSDSARGTDVRVAGPGQARLAFARVLTPLAPDAGPAGAAGGVTAGWSAPDGAAHRGVFASLHSPARGNAHDNPDGNAHEDA